nr:zinc finger, CCHC-type [Tanacetum cinerariifolium]
MNYSAIEKTLMRLFFVVAIVKKIYAHESLTFNNIVACEVISKWKAGLKDNIDARSNVYMLNNGCEKCSDDNDGYYWEYTPAKGKILGMEIFRIQSGNTLRVSQSRVYNGKLVHNLLEEHSIPSLEDDVTSKVVLYMNMGFNKSGKYKKTFIGSGVGTGSVQVLQGVKFEVEP